tara:strand:+ start:272 stop:517 length:246 start_codon:yes stop_codon:yes gene_type:complete
MGEAQRKFNQNLNHSRKEKKNKKPTSSRILSWLPITEEQEQGFIQLTIRGSWIGIGCLILLWIIVRIIGPAAGWWVPADLK